MENSLHLKAILPVNALNAGYCITRGIGWHADRTIQSFEIIYVNSGTLGIFEEDKEFDIEEGQALILFPGRHHGGTRQFDKNLSFYWLHFLIDEKAQNLGDSIMSLPQHLGLAKPEQFVELFRRFIKRQEYREENQTILNLILLEILCEMTDSSLPIDISNQRVVFATRIDQYIKMHLDQPLSTSYLATQLECNPDYLGRTFQQVFHKNITTAIHEHRLNKAVRLLLESSCNVNQIANLCGYEDVNYFRRIFKKYRGRSPKEYRKLYCLIDTHINA